MTTANIQMPEGAPEEVVTHALVRDVDLGAFGHKGTLALITLDNGLDHTRPNTRPPLIVIGYSKILISGYRYFFNN